MGVWLTPLLLSTWLHRHGLRLHFNDEPLQPGCSKGAVVATTQSVFYRDKDGIEPADDFINDLGPIPAAKIDDRIEEYLNGKPINAPPPEFPISSQIEGELRELRIRFAKTHFRILYRRSENLVVLLHAFEKNTGAVEEADKAIARSRFADFKRRMNAQPRRGPRAAGHDAPPKSRYRP